jgi:hypothetical protein
VKLDTDVRFARNTFTVFSVAFFLLTLWHATLDDWRYAVTTGLISLLCFYWRSFALSNQETRDKARKTLEATQEALDKITEAKNRKI